MKIKLFGMLFIFHFYSYSQGVWMAKKDFAGTPRVGAVGFSIGSKGYIGAGYDGNDQKDFWEWDQATDTWTQKADFDTLLTAGRMQGVGFSIGTKGYIATGYSNKRDLREWDQNTNTWS